MIGRKLRNRYVVREHLGDGSTAAVYRALDERLGREVAIKMLLPHVRDTTRKRFLQEASAAAKLNHPNVMHIYDIDDDEGRLFLVLEFVEGSSLAKFIPSSPETLVSLGIQIARALNYAHEHGIIHRDIKPANIQVTSRGVVKLMDLGLALSKESQRVTAAGMVIGTPAYLSPEQAQGQPLDPRTDIYSLGIVLYEMATGRLPFGAEDIGALLLQQVKQPPPPPRAFAPHLSADLEHVILKTLEKSPVRRYQSCEALALALESCLQVMPTRDLDAVDGDPSTTDTLSMGVAVPQRRTLRLVLADDHTLLRKTLLNMLEERDEFMVVGEAGDGEAALRQVLSTQPDLLILDLNMPVKTGLEVLPEVRKQAPQVKVLVLSGRQEESYIMRAMRAGAHGYILKSSEESELVDAINKVMQGQMYLGHGVAEKVITGMLNDADRERKLDDTETAIMLYIAAGLENESIARKLGLSMITVIESLARAMNKLGARDRHSAALKAIKHGYILLEELHALPDADSA
jgi:serine/threonine protein kinase/DNA-binding CsgD family transcriptional regulator